jgi:hypothetical protein
MEVGSEEKFASYGDKAEQNSVTLDFDSSAEKTIRAAGRTRSYVDSKVGGR